MLDTPSSCTTSGRMPATILSPRALVFLSSRTRLLHSTPSPRPILTQVLLLLGRRWVEPSHLLQHNSVPRFVTCSRSHQIRFSCGGSSGFTRCLGCVAFLLLWSRLSPLQQTALSRALTMSSLENFAQKCQSGGQKLYCELP